jgi:hypothetical protein
MIMTRVTPACLHGGRRASPLYPRRAPPPPAAVGAASTASS